MYCTHSKRTTRNKIVESYKHNSKIHRTFDSMRGVFLGLIFTVLMITLFIKFISGITIWWVIDITLLSVAPSLVIIFVQGLIFESTSAASLEDVHTLLFKLYKDEKYHVIDHNIRLEK